MLARLYVLCQRKKGGEKEKREGKHNRNGQKKLEIYTS